MPYPAPALLDDEGEAFARAVFRRFLRQATICRDIDDAIEHMHIVNDNSRTFDIRLGGETRIPVGRELILALAAKKKELLALCESALRAPRATVASSPSAHAHQPLGTAGTIAGADASGASAGGGSFPPPAPPPLVFPPPAALAAMESSRSPSSGSAMISRPSVVVPPTGASGGAGARPNQPNVVVAEMAIEAAETAPAIVQPTPVQQVQQQPVPAVASTPVMPESKRSSAYGPSRPASSTPPVRESRGDSRGPKTIFVRKVIDWFWPQTMPVCGQCGPRRAGHTTRRCRRYQIDMKTPREDVMEHFKEYGEVVAISMNPTRGYAFVDFPSHDCVLRALSAPSHVINRKTLEVEMKKELPVTAHRQGGRAPTGSFRTGRGGADRP